METLWGPQGCGDHMGTTWRQHADNVGTTGCGDHMGQHGDHMGTT